MSLLPSLRILWWGGLGVVFIASLSAANHYHRRFTLASQANAHLQQQLAQAGRQLAQQRAQQAKVASLDQQLTEELTDEKNHIALLEQRVRLGQRRLQLHARCPVAAAPAAGAAGMADATGARLTDAAQRDYFTLRRRIVRIQSQINGLQAYIRLQSTALPVPER
jgi:prophage endopeptidase